MSDDGVTRGWEAVCRLAETDPANYRTVCLDADREAPMHFRRIPAGEFLMGSRSLESLDKHNEEPRHRVVIPREFHLACFPVTQRQWRTLMGTTPKEMEDTAKSGSTWGDVTAEGDLHPMPFVNFHDAQDFLEALRRQPGGETARLPCEAEWEYACRGGTSTEYHNGDGEAALRDVGWYNGNAEDRTHRVGSKAPNDWGLYDMHGNVWEWCMDAYASSAYAGRADCWVAAPWETADEDPNRVIRGGSWANATGQCRAAVRNPWPPGFRDWCLGFRVLLGVPPVRWRSREQAGAEAGRERE